MPLNLGSEEAQQYELTLNRINFNSTRDKFHESLDLDNVNKFLPIDQKR